MKKKIGCGLAVFVVLVITFLSFAIPGAVLRANALKLGCIGRAIHCCIFDEATTAKALNKKESVWPVEGQYKTSTEYFKNIISNGILEGVDFSFFGGPGIKPPKGNTPDQFTADNNAWCITLLPNIPGTDTRESVDGETPFIFTKNRKQGCDLVLTISNCTPILVFMITRAIESHIQKCFSVYPVVTITGPRQSGKTTLAKACFPHLPYINLENMENRQFAIEDPIAFMNNIPNGAILDEIQNVPDLTSYIQVRVDEKKQNGLFVLTGSCQFSLMEKFSQSLAGRTAVVTLLPFSMTEIKGQYQGLGTNTDDYIFRGFYPRLYDQLIPPSMGLSDYVTTYIEKDLRRLSQIQNLALFQKFMKLCAGRTGQLLNASGLAEDTGINHKTAQEWISLLETSYILFRLPPYFANISKRLIKSPKLYFYDTGLAANLLGIESAAQIETHPLRGALFENLIIGEIIKYRANRGKRPNLAFFRDAKGHEVDLLYHQANNITPIEIKSAATVRNDFVKGLKYFQNHIQHSKKSILAYDGDRDEERSDLIITNSNKITNWL